MEFHPQFVRRWYGAPEPPRGIIAHADATGPSTPRALQELRLSRTGFATWEFALLQ